MKATPFVQGILMGYALPWLLLAPAAFMGRLAPFLTTANTFLLLPAFTLLMVPGAIAGWWAAYRFPERQGTWRFSTGLFVGGSLAAGLLFWLANDEYGYARRLVSAVYGGPFLGGFWLWIGAFLGSAVAYGRIERAKKTLDPVVP